MKILYIISDKDLDAEYKNSKLNDKKVKKPI